MPAFSFSLRDSLFALAVIRVDHLPPDFRVIKHELALVSGDPMRDEARRKLDRHLALKGGAKWLKLSLGLAAALAFGYFIYRPGTMREVPATVRVAVMGNDPDTGTRYAQIELELADGTIVIGGSSAPLPPPARGARIIVRERTSAIGRRSYVWEGRMQ